MSMCLTKMLHHHRRLALLVKRFKVGHVTEVSGILVTRIQLFYLGKPLFSFTKLLFLQKFITIIVEILQINTLAFLIVLLIKISQQQWYSGTLNSVAVVASLMKRINSRFVITEISLLRKIIQEIIQHQLPGAFHPDLCIHVGALLLKCRVITVGSLRQQSAVLLLHSHFRVVLAGMAGTHRHGH